MKFTKLRKLFTGSTQFKRLYVGSQNGFLAQKFHEHCDNKGPTITVCKSENDSIFGLYVTVPWQS